MSPFLIQTGFYLYRLDDYPADHSENHLYEILTGHAMLNEGESRLVDVGRIMVYNRGFYDDTGDMHVSSTLETFKSDAFACF